MPSVQVSSVPWIPAPSKIPSQRALIGFEGPGGIDCPASEPAQAEFGNVPGRVFRHFLDFVETFGRFEAFLPDRDGVGLGQLQVLPEPQRVGGAVEGQVARVLGRDFAAGHLRLHRVGAGGDRVVGVGVEDRRVDLVGQQVVAKPAAVFGGDDFQRVAGRVDRGVLRFAVDRFGDLADEPIDRRPASR